MSGNLQFKLEGEAALKESTTKFGNVSGSSLAGKFTLTQSGLDALLTFHTSFLDVELGGELGTDGRLCLSGDAKLDGIDVTLDVAYCNSGANAGLKGAGSIGEFSFSGALAADSFSLTASAGPTTKKKERLVVVADQPVIVVGATITYDLTATLTNTSFSVSGGGDASIYTRWPDSSEKSTLASVNVAVDTEEAEACAVVEVDVPTQGTRRVSLCTKTS